MKETSEEIVKRLQELTRKRAEDRKKKWKEDLVFRMKNDNPMYNPVYKAKVIDKLKGNKNASKMGKKSRVPGEGRETMEGVAEDTEGTTTTGFGG